jgi:TolB-like protein/DNA-binding winged helix-turn-helix (wHTH) protein/Flp pilus assembly protein TadD
MDENNSNLYPDHEAQASNAAAPRYVRFGVFEADLQKSELRKNGMRVKVQEKPFQILAVLLEQAGEVVSRDTLRHRLWPADTYVNFDANLNTGLNKLRLVLGDSADQPALIQTIPRRGYVFIGPIEVLKGPGGGSSEARDAKPAALEVLPEPPMPAKPRLGGLRRTMVVAAASAAVTMAVFWLLWPRLRAMGYAPEKTAGHRTLLVVPFENLSGDATQEYFSDGLTDEMITTLGGLQPSRLRVIARASSMAYKSAHRTVHQMAADTGADVLLTGGVHRSKDRVRITAQLIDARSQANLWTETYERDAANLFELQREVAQHIAQSLSLELLTSPDRPVAKSPEAYNDYLKGLYYWNQRGPANLKKAVVYFEQAVEKDPRYAPAYVGLAQTHLVSVSWMATLPEPGYTKARTAAEKALSLDPSLSGAHAALAGVYYEHDRDWSRAEKEFQRAIELNAGDASAHQWYAEFLTALGRHSEAIAQMMRARDLDPLSLVISADLADILNYARRYQDAIAVSRKTLEADPSYVPAHEALAEAYFLQGQYAEGVAERQKAMQLRGQPLEVVAGYGQAFERGGIEGLRRWKLAAISRATSPTDCCIYKRALVYAEVGDRDRAIENLEQAARDRAPGIEFVAVDPRLDSLRNVPRFQEFLHHLGYPTR